MLGKIARLNEDRGFGFIQPDGCRDVRDNHFFHAKHLVGVYFSAALKDMRVEFESTVEPKGLVARNVREARD